MQRARGLLSLPHDLLQRVIGGQVIGEDGGQCDQHEQEKKQAMATWFAREFAPRARVIAIVSLAFLERDGSGFAHSYRMRGSTKP